MASIADAAKSAVAQDIKKAASSVLGGGLSLPPLNLSANSRSGDIYASNDFRTGNFGGGFDLGDVIEDYWWVLAAGGVAWWWIKRKKK